MKVKVLKKIQKLKIQKIENFEIFYPDRIANRILGMGDIVSLVEKAAEDLDQENLKKNY